MASSPAATAAAVVADPGGGTANTTSETIVGSYVFKIDGFSGTKDLGVGKSIRSSTFRVGGYGWFIDCYPCGDDEENAGWVTLDLFLDHPGPKDQVDTECHYTLIDYNAADRFRCAIQKGTYTTLGCSIKFFKRDELEPILKNDCFQVRCDVSVIKEFPAVPPPDLHRRLGDLLAIGLGGDVTFEVGGEQFNAHRCILATRCSVFMEELLGSWNENTAPHHIWVDDMEPKVFKALLHFIYTDTLCVLEDDDKVIVLQHLLLAAERYKLGTLKSTCEEMLCNCIDASMAATTLTLADKHGCHKLKEACITFLTDLLVSVQGPAGQGSSLLLFAGKRKRS